MVLKFLFRSNRRSKRRRRSFMPRMPRRSQNLVSDTISIVRKLQKPSTLFIPPFIKNIHQQVTRHTVPQKFIAYHLAKRRNKRLNALRDSIKRSFIIPLTKKLYDSPMSDQEKLDKFSRKICHDRKVRRDEIMRKTAGKGLSIKNAKWSDISKFIKCEKKRS